MYRITENKRIQRSASLIKDALIACLQEKNFDEITVSDIQRISGVSRATFYRIFDNTTDVLVYYCELLTASLTFQTEHIMFENHRDFLLFIFRAMMDNHVFVEAVFRSGCEDILLNILLDYTMKQHAAHVSPDTPVKEMDYIISGICGYLIGIMKIWIKHGKQESPEELYQIIENFSQLISSTLFRAPE